MNSIDFLVMKIYFLNNKISIVQHTNECYKVLNIIGFSECDVADGNRVGGMH